MLNRESGLDRLRLGQLLDVLIPSDRIKIFDGENEKAPVLYTGFVACLDYDQKEIDKTRRIARTGLGVDTFRVDDKTEKWNSFAHARPLKNEVPVESISNYKSSELEHIIYTRIFLEGKADE